MRLFAVFARRRAIPLPRPFKVLRVVDTIEAHSMVVRPSQAMEFERFELTVAFYLLFAKSRKSIATSGHPLSQ